MEPAQEQPQKPIQEIPQESASAYYNSSRKRSFFLSRLTVFASMFVLLVVLTINISLLYSNDKSTISSHAAEPVNPIKLLPSLAQGCSYQKIKGELTVACATPTPTITVPINVILPQLPPQCSLETTANGNKIHCNTIVPIPTVPVTLPSTCQATNQTNKVSCTEDNQTVVAPLPSIPAGCSYQMREDKYFVQCQSE